MDTMFKFGLSTQACIGPDASLQLGAVIRDGGYARVGIIVDAAVSRHPQVSRAIASVRESGGAYDVLPSSFVEPTYDDLEAFARQCAGRSFDCLAGIGGGSVLDLAKGVATLLTNEGPALSFRGFPKLAHRPLPVIAIPTTAGTGSEVTYNAVFTDAREKKKLGINSTHNFPIAALVDPAMTVDCPQSVTVSSGCDALVHTLESFVHRNHTPLSRMFSREAFHLIAGALAVVLEKPSDLQVRGDLALGAFLAGVALMNAGSGPAGAFSYPLGAVYKVPHGYAGAVFLSSITRHNVVHGYADYAELYDCLDGADCSLSRADKNHRFVNHIAGLMDALGVPRSLTVYGLGLADIDFLAGQYELLKAAIAQNPVDISSDDVRAMLNELR